MAESHGQCRTGVGSDIGAETPCPAEGTWRLALTPARAAARMYRPAGKEFSCAWPPGGHQRYAFPAFVLAGGGAGDDWTGRPGRGGPRPAQGGARRPRRRYRNAEGRVHARSADQGRAQPAGWPGARGADVRRAGRAHLRPPPAPAAAGPARPPRPGPAPTAGQGGRQVRHLPDHRGPRLLGRQRHRSVRCLARRDGRPVCLRPMDGGRHHGVRAVHRMGPEVPPQASAAPAWRSGPPSRAMQRRPPGSGSPRPPHRPESRRPAGA